jgi:hypothetical protein
MIQLVWTSALEAGEQSAHALATLPAGMIPHPVPWPGLVGMGESLFCTMTVIELISILKNLIHILYGILTHSR